MVAERSDSEEISADTPMGESRSGHGWQRILAMAGLSLLLLLLVALAALWVARRPIASNILEREFERRGVQATYDLERVGLRTQVVRNLVIGDPQDPDLFARYALIQIRPTLSGSFEVYRVVARGVRLEGRLVDGQVSWGQLDEMLPPPSGEPFRLPSIVVDVQDATISLRTPYGPLGFAVSGSGNLTGGFRGNVAVRTPEVDFGTCRVSSVSGLFDIRIVARRPQVKGPFAAQRFVCPDSRMAIDKFQFDIDSSFSEGFDSFDGSGRFSAQTIVAGVNGLAALTGTISFDGTPGDARGKIGLAALRSRLGPVTAERTRLSGGYRIDSEAGTIAFVGDYGADDASVAEMAAGLTGALSGLANTPIGPISTAIGRALERSARSFDASGELRIVNGPGYGAARIESANVRTATGGRIQFGGQGVTYYWPTNELRIDGRVQMAGGGLPAGTVDLNQQRPNGPISGVARLQPYTVGDSRLALAPLRFRAAPGGATEFSTVAQLTGSFPDGRVRGLQLPLSGRIGPSGAVRVGQSCIVARFDYLRFRELELNGTRVPVCPVNGAIVSTSAAGDVRIGARMVDPDFSGRLGQTPIRVAADWARIAERDFLLQDPRLRLGDPESPVAFSAERLQGTFRGSGISGTFTGGEGTIGNVPLLISEADADWRVQSGDLFIDGGVTVSDRAEEPRFYPLRSENFSFVLSDDIRAGGTLRHPDSGTPVTDITIDHDLDSGAGEALLDVPGLTFGEALQPEELTPLTEGVVALVVGTIRGQGRIAWDPEGEVTSTGTFTTNDMDLAAPFGPVEGLATTIRFTDLLGMETAPGQVATVRSINPGILVENGTIRYQILPDQLVRIERGEWPFMGGRLILQETILNFGRPSAKRLTFELVGFDAKQFIDSLGFEGLEIVGTFDGVLPIIFDESGGRIVGGRLESRPGGGYFRYTGTKPDAGLVAGAAFDLLSDIRYQSMVIRLDGDLAGEFATRFTISEISLGQEGGFVAGLIRNAFDDVPLRVNLSITGPFRALIQMAKGFEDPTAVIAPVMPFPLDAPGIVTETRTLRKEEDQTQTQPPEDEVEVSTQPPQPSER